MKRRLSTRLFRKRGAKKPSLGQQILTQIEQLNGRIEELEEKIDENNANLEEKIDENNAKIEQLQSDIGTVVETSARGRVELKHGHNYAVSFAIRSLLDMASYFTTENSELSINRAMVLRDFVRYRLDEFIKWTTENEMETKSTETNKLYRCSGAGLQVLSWVAFDKTQMIEEMELDCKGRVDIYNDRVAQIDIGEVKARSTPKLLSKAKRQVKKNLTVLAFALSKMIPTLNEVITVGRIMYNLGKDAEQSDSVVLREKSPRVVLSLVVSRIK